MQSTLGRLQGMFQRCAHSLEFSLQKRPTMLTRLCRKCRDMYAPVATRKYAGHCCDKVATKDITVDVNMQRGVCIHVQVLVDKLKNGGRLIIPVGEQNAVQVQSCAHLHQPFGRLCASTAWWLQHLLMLGYSLCRYLSC